jgi:hypothetical protein
MRRQTISLDASPVRLPRARGPTERFSQNNRQKAELQVRGCAATPTATMIFAVFSRFRSGWIVFLSKSFASANSYGRQGACARFEGIVLSVVRIRLYVTKQNG